MRINQVLERVYDRYPNEYKPYDIYLWCDEVSAMLTQEDRMTYHERTLPVSSDGVVVLPTGVTVDYIVEVEHNGTILERKDITAYGKRTLNIKGLNGTVTPVDKVTSGEVRVIYQVPFSPIRLPKYEGAAEVERADGRTAIAITENVFLPNDLINIIQGENEITDIPVIFIDYDGEKDKYILDIAEDIDITTGEVEILRTITDTTVCDAPFDTMYVDYCLAQIHRLQGDMTAYNQCMQMFNSRYSAYLKWLVPRTAQRETKLRNWW